ncbi:KinB-signaling pathway activation protein [Aneurinibacillus terranovensis]|uniref:KinB-signaling pathway activation protein n=1 Tax=Aneurinibacillus terranovensis TaxID=278991 RepID=UPI0003FD7822|nr:KinB-signaling pathway activation protein [Aneurinibacillus terranovensis]
MNLKKWSFLFFSTLLLGGIGGLVSGVIIGQETFKNGFANFGMGLFGNVLAGIMFSVISQMGFFAYLTINYMALGFFKKKSLWEGIQIILILLVFIDLVVLRHDIFAGQASLLSYVVLPAVLLVLAVVVAFFKVQATNRTAWIPTVFFMFAVTTLEWVPALRTNNIKSMLFMLIPLFLCNIWQIMQLHRLVKSS